MSYLGFAAVVLALLLTPGVAKSQDIDPALYEGCVGPNPPKGVITPKPTHSEMPALVLPESRVARTAPVVTTLKISVDQMGKVVRAAIVKPSDVPAWDTSALDAVQRWTFSPGTINSKPAAMCFLFRMIARPNVG